MYVKGASPFAAFTDHYRKQRSNQNPIKLSKEVNESLQQTAPQSREKQGSKGSWVPVGRQHATGNYSVQPSVVKTTDHGQVVQHVQEVRPRGGGGSEAGDEGLTVIQEVHRRTGSAAAQKKPKGGSTRLFTNCLMNIGISFASGGDLGDSVKAT